MKEEELSRCEHCGWLLDNNNSELCEDCQEKLDEEENT